MEKTSQQNKNPVLGNQIQIRMFLGLLDPDPDPLVRGTDPDPEIICLWASYKKKSEIFFFFES
jgi:hypothetical protein